MRPLIDALNDRQHASAGHDLPQPVSSSHRLPIEILVAEDNEVNQKMIMLALNKLGYNATLADNGRVALDLMKNNRYQLVFMDLMMPEVDGYQAATHIFQEFTKEERPILIAVTANAVSGERERILAFGMDDYISKPYKIQDIKDKLELWESKLREKYELGQKL